MSENIQLALKQHYGFDAFRPGQEEVVSRVMSGHSTAAIFPTGAGKSLCYQLPALMLPHLTLVVSPLLSLMQDQLDFLLSHNVPAARLDSSLKGDAYNSVLNQAANGELKILMISVERFKNERFRNKLRQMKISLLVIDEAHCISEWGHNFRPEYLRLPDYQREFGIEQALLLTATATAQVREDMCEKFHIAPGNLINTGFYRENLYLRVSALEEPQKGAKLLADIAKAPDASTIIYVTLQKTAESVAAFLQEGGVNAAFYHAGMDTAHRESVQNRFMEGQLGCVVATIAFGMGIDKSDIRRVIHYDLPKSIENYSQEIGRAGRDGNKSLCEVYASVDKLPVLENFIYGDTPDREGILSLLKMIQAEAHRWECKPLSLSKELNIRLLPLKTLFVYLAMKKIIEPLYTYFEEYSFKFIRQPDEITASFQGDRQRFVTDILSCCYSKKVWTSVDMEAIEQIYPGDRKRVIAALNYFADQQWIDLTAKQGVDAYRVIQNDFNADALADELFTLFKEKEENGISRIHGMIGFFESSTCLSRGLASYFGEDLARENCGHCSVCAGQVASFQRPVGHDISASQVEELISEIRPLLGVQASPDNLTRFLCGIMTPLLQKHKAKSLRAFAVLETYPYQEVLAKVRATI